MSKCKYKYLINNKLSFLSGTVLRLAQQPCTVPRDVSKKKRVSPLFDLLLHYLRSFFLFQNWSASVFKPDGVNVNGFFVFAMFEIFGAVVPH